MFSLILLLIVALVTMYTALIYDNTDMMLLGFSVAALFLVSFFVLLIRKFTIRISMEIPVGISETGRENTVKLNVSNNGILPVKRMAVYVIIEDETRLKKKKFWMRLSNLSAYNNVYFNNFVFDKAGNYRVYIRKLRVYDWTNLFYCTIRINESDVIQVLPKVHDVMVKLTNATTNFYGEADIFDKGKSGYDNTELFSVREYMPGDRLQSVHWKATAKQDELMVKEGSLPLACPVVLFLGYSAKNSKKDQDVMAYIEVAVSISFSLIEVGCPHYVVWYDGKNNEIERFRVDNDESLYMIMVMIMEILWPKCEEDIEKLYKERYSLEKYAFAISLDRDFAIKKNGEVLAVLPKDSIGKGLKQVDLVL